MSYNVAYPELGLLKQNQYLDILIYIFNVRLITVLNKVCMNNLCPTIDGYRIL